MKQYRITTRSYAEDHIPDAVMASDDLAKLKQLAGIGAGLLEDYTVPMPADAKDRPSMSPVGSNISITGMEKQRLEKQLHIVPGSPEWFRLWFSRPYLTGEKPVGDAPPDAERNPRYLLDKNGQANQEKVEKFSSAMDKKNRDQSSD